MDTNETQAHTASGKQEPSPAEALHLLQQQFGELQAYVTHFISAKIDGFVLSARQLALWIVLGMVGLTAVVGLIVTAMVLVLLGTAHGVALLCGGRWWLGALIVGGGTLALLALGIIIGMRTWQDRWLQQKVQQYDERQLQQHDTFGYSAADRATAEAAIQHQ
jgi:hypothetical protein